MSSPPAPQIAPSLAEQFFGLSARPFSLTPDLRFAFQSRSHSHAMADVSEALRRREGLIVVTGAIGTGKTMLCRSMLQTFETRTFLSVILDPRLDAEELLRQVLADFGIIERTGLSAADGAPAGSRHQLVTALQQFLASLTPLQAHAVIMIDEAQHLSPDVLEEIRLLSNFETDEAKLLQIVLVGQPDLETVLRRPDMRQLNQRVARHCQLYPLSSAEVAEYVDRRISVAASLPQPGPPTAGTHQAASVVRFSPTALACVADLSGGIPRLVNTLCDRALDAAYERQVRVIDPDAVITAAERLHVDLPAQMTRPATAPSPVVRTPPAAIAVPLPLREQPDMEAAVVPQRRGTPIVAAAAILVVLLLVGGWLWTRRSNSTMPPAPRAATSSDASRSGVSSQPTPPTQPVDVPSGAQPPSVTPPRPDGADRPASTTGRPSAVAPSDGPFTIAVASFRTEQRAQDVATAITTLQVPAGVRQDQSGAWYQVVAGPFPSRESAAGAQGVLSRNGYGDTRISPSTSDAR